MKYRQTMSATEGVVSGGVTIEGDTIWEDSVKKISRRLKREMKELHKDMMKEVKKQSRTL